MNFAKTNHLLDDEDSLRAKTYASKKEHISLSAMRVQKRKKITLVLLLAGVFAHNLNLASAATPIQVSAILVKTNKWDRNCYGSYYVATVDLSIKDLNRLGDCSIRTLVNKKISGTHQLQIYENNTWQDLLNSNHWMATNSIFENYKGISTYAYARKLQNYNFGVLVSPKKSVVSSHNVGADWDGPLPWLDKDNAQIGGDVFDNDVTEVKLRVKVVSKGKSYFSNSVVFTYKNQDFFVWGRDKYGFKERVPRSESTTQASPQSPNSSSSSSGGDKSSVCRTATQSSNALSYIKASVSDPTTSQLILENVTDCFFTVQVIASFWCKTPSNSFRSVTTMQIGPRERISSMPGYYSQYFPTAINQCAQISGTANGSNWAIFSSYPPNASILIISSNS